MLILIFNVEIYCCTDMGMKNPTLGVVLTLLLLPFMGRTQAPSPKVRGMIAATMQAQEEAWNRGDLKGFMDGYWESDSLRFIGKSGITRGWSQTLANYERGYPDRAAMGKLTFTILIVEKLGPRCVGVTGKWHLQREKDAPQGYFSLIWKKMNGKWVIVADHSS